MSYAEADARQACDAGTDTPWKTSIAVGIAFRVERNTVDRIVGRLRLHP